MPDSTVIDWARRYGGRSALGRVMSKVDRRSADGCWIWNASVSDTGYGSVGVQRQKFNAHRLLFELWYGPVPPGLELDHICRTRACVNPEHLEPVTRWENNIRGTSPSAMKALATHCPRGHEYTDGNIYRRPDGKGINCRTCAHYRSLRRTDRKYGWITQTPL